MTEHGSPEELRRATEAADALISRLQEAIADRLARTGEIDEAEGFYELVQLLETSPEITTVRMALGRDPHRVGEPTPLSRPGHTG
ncbi:hypothetical protein [Phenylobacterium sp. J367]|uniref:hypothetical protein n=1 Tax=Phenylobacterium sp. J367 TaxID=2898435 RepID=UPI002151008B|nr:hypothetical protein [Phenylobacterium sp. J367]MCR5877938.1 hypothetical protein [Phenylobacterium sp. J367]